MKFLHGHQQSVPGANVPLAFSLAVLTTCLVASSAFGLDLPAFTEKTETFPAVGPGKAKVLLVSRESVVLKQYGGFKKPWHVVGLADGSFLVADAYAKTIFQIGSRGEVLRRILCKGLPLSVRPLEDGGLVYTEFQPNRVIQLNANNEVIHEYSNELRSPQNVARQPDGSFFISDGRFHGHILELAPDLSLRRERFKDFHIPSRVIPGPNGGFLVLDENLTYLSWVKDGSPPLRVFNYTGRCTDLQEAPDGCFLLTMSEQQKVALIGSDYLIKWQASFQRQPLSASVSASGDFLIALSYTPDEESLWTEELKAWALDKKPSRYPYLVFPPLLAALLVWIARRKDWSKALGGNDEVLPAAQEPSAISQWRLTLSPRTVSILLFILLIPAIFGALYAQTHLRAGSAPKIYWFYITCAFWAAYCLRIGDWVRARTPTTRDVFPQPESALTPDLKSIVFLFLWLLCLVGMVLIIARNPANLWSLALWTLCPVLLLGAALMKRFPSICRQCFSSSNRASLMGGVALAIVTVGLRVWRLDTIPLNLHQDMASHGLSGLDLLFNRQPLWSNGYAEMPMTSFISCALTMAVFGKTLVGLNMASAILGSLAVWAVYGIAKELCGKTAAWISASLLALSYAHIHFSRTASYMDPAACLCIGMYFLVRAFKRNEGGSFVLSGIANGFSTLLYFSGRISPFVLLFAFALMLSRKSMSLRRRWFGCCLFLSASISTVAPIATLYAKQPEMLIGRAGVFRGYEPATQSLPVMKLLKDMKTSWPQALGMFFDRGDNGSQFSDKRPIFPPLLSVLFAVGLAYSSLRFWNYRAGIPLFWLLLVLTIGGAMTIETPFFPRLLILFAPACILAAVGIERIVRVAFGSARLLGWFVLAGMLCTVSYLEVRELDYYFNHLVKGRDHKGKLFQDNVWYVVCMGRTLRDLGPGYRGYIVPNLSMNAGCQHRSVRFLTFGLDVSDAMEIQDVMPFPENRRDVAVIVETGRMDALDYLTKVYPRAKVIENKSNTGRSIFNLVLIKQEELREVREKNLKKGTAQAVTVK